MTDWRALRDQLFERCHGYCEFCGWPMASDNWAAHHRLRRAQGGRHELSNLVAIHHGCHSDAVHNNPTLAFLAGFLVHNGQDPASVPLRLPGGSKVLLGTGYTPWEGTE